MTSEAQDLTAALRAIPGVADAEVASETAEGVRVRLASDADPTDVAAAVRDVLAGHGLKGRMAPPQARIEPLGPPPPPVAMATRAALGPRLVQTTIEPADDRPELPSSEAAESEVEIPPPPQSTVVGPTPSEPAVVGATASEPAMVSPALLEPAVVSPPPPEPDRVEEIIREPQTVSRTVTADKAPPALAEEPAEGNDAPPVGRAARPLLSRVRVQEDRGGVAVTVETEDGESVTRRGRPSDDGVREAVVAAVGELSGDQPPPVLVNLSEHELGGHPVITVVVQRHDGTYHVGSAMIGAQKAFALARATWAAMGQAR